MAELCIPARTRCAHFAASGAFGDRLEFCICTNALKWPSFAASHHCTNFSNSYEYVSALSMDETENLRGKSKQN